MAKKSTAASSAPQRRRRLTGCSGTPKTVLMNVIISFLALSHLTGSWRAHVAAAFTHPTQPPPRPRSIGARTAGALRLSTTPGVTSSLRSKMLPPRLRTGYCAAADPPRLAFPVQLSSLFSLPHSSARSPLQATGGRTSVGVVRLRRRWSSPPSRMHGTESSTEETATGIDDKLTSLGTAVTDALQKCTDRIKDVKVAVRPCDDDGMRMGLFATQKIRKNDLVISVPYDDTIVLTPALARKVTKGLPDKYDGWTGDLGLLAMLVLRELASASSSSGSASSSSGRSPEVGELMRRWALSLPTLEEMRASHPLLWESEDDQEELQNSSTKKIYRMLDDAEEDAAWLVENVWDKDRETYPETVTIERRGGVAEEQVPCYGAEGFKWALAVASSRAVFVDGSLRLVPVVDFANHDDGAGTMEVVGGKFGTFGTTSGAQIRAGRDYEEGEQVFVSYGPKSAAEYLLEHGFIPDAARTTAVAELTFEVDENDRFFDDKVDVLEFETYGDPIEPVQSFDVVAAPGKDGEPDPSMVQFLRLAKLGGKDAFLLESIFRKEVWGFMGLPVSEENEMAVVDAIVEACDAAIAEMDSAVADGSGGPEADEKVAADPDAPTNARACATVRIVERRALQRTREYMLREREALDLKEYYQERRLKDLGLDSEWEDDSNPDVGWGQTRAPGGGDLDW